MIALGCAIYLTLSASHVFAAPTLPPDPAAAELYSPNAQGCSGTPSIQYAYASPNVISPGQVTTLYWGLVTNANAAYLKHPNGHQVGIGTPGSQQVNPTQTSTYTVIGACGGNQIQVPIQVTVQGGPSCNGTPVLQGFNANPSSIGRGQTATLSWGPVLNATYVQLSSQTQGGSGVPTPGQSQVRPGQTTTYYLTAWCQSNSAQAQVTVNVNAPPPPTPPPVNRNQVRQVQVERANRGQIKVTVNYFWNGEDAPAYIQSWGSSAQRRTASDAPTTGIIAGYVKFVIQYITPKLGQPLTSVTSCIYGKSGTELACLTVPPP
jgi:hypothetical protein